MIKKEIQLNTTLLNDESKQEMTSLSRRSLVISTALISGGAFTALPTHWKAPIINAVVLPVHAQMSPTEEPEVPEEPEETCSSYSIEPVNEPILITVTDTEIRGPIIVQRTDPLVFAGFEESELTECSATDNFTQEVTFNGTIDSANNQITGELAILQFCGDILVCEQLTDYTAVQGPITDGDDLGVYTGTTVGTLRCCDDFL